MKTSWYIILFVFLALGFGLAGYFLAKSGKKDPVEITHAPDRKLIAQNDSFNQAKTVKEVSINQHKKKLSPYSRSENNYVPSVDTMKADIHTFQDIVREQDTLIKMEARQIASISNKLYEKTDQLAGLQNRYNNDMDRQKRTRVNVFLSGVGVGAGVILIAVLIL